MKITSISVEGVGKFGTRSEISGLGPGVNILTAGNEAGKSTLFRAVRACLFERHNTKNEAVRTLATDGLALPVTVTLGFEHDNLNYKVTKSFMKSPTASLVRDNVELARGREADEMVWELLGIAPGAGRTVDEAAYGILWVGQGQSFNVPEPTEAAASALNTAIQAEVGTLVGGERARSVLSALKEELAQLITETGRPKAGGALAEAIAHVDSLQRDLSDAETRLSVLDVQLVELAAKRSEHGRLGEPALLSKMTTDLELAQQDLKLGERAAALLTQFETAEQRSKAGLDRVEQHLLDLHERRNRIDGDRKRESELRDGLMPLDAQEQAARGVIRLAREEIAALNAQAEREDEQERTLQRAVSAIARTKARDSLAQQQRGLEELGERLVKNEGSLANNRATASILTSLDAAERELSLLTARLEAEAPEVTVELGVTGAGQVLMGDTPLVASAVQAAIEPLTIRVRDVVTITVSPPSSADSTNRKKRQDAQKLLVKLIEDTGVANASELRAARARRQALEGEAVGLQAEIKVLGVQDKSPALAIERIKTEIEQIDAMVTEALAQTKLETLPSAEDLAARQNTLRQNREEARRKRQTLDGTIDAQNIILSNLADSRGRFGGTLTEIHNRLDGDLAVLSDADRAQIIAGAEAAVASARDDYGAKAAALEEQRGNAPSREELERRHIRIDRLHSALEGQKSRLGLLDKEIANLEGQIQSAGGDGLGEKVEALRQERDLTNRQIEKYQARVAASLLAESGATRTPIPAQGGQQSGDCGQQVKAA